MTTHVCERCEHWFTIAYPVDLGHRVAYGRNMVYVPSMNRSYAVCPECGGMEHQFSAEARDQERDAEGNQYEHE